MKEYKYYFGRLNIAATYESKRDFINAALRTNEHLLSHKYIWAYISINHIDYNGEDYFSGYLIKADPEKEEEVVNLEEHEIDTERIQNSIVAKSFFLLHVKTGVIAYHPVSNKISKNAFRNRFSELFQKAHDNLFINADLQPISEEYRLREMLSEFEKIYEVEIKLHPSNPSFRDIWEEHDKRMRDLGVDNYKESYKAEKEGEGIKAKDDDIINEKIAMAEDGYGSAEAKGDIDGELRIISTEQNQIWEKAPADDARPIRILNELIEKFNEIFRRFIH